MLPTVASILSWADSYSLLASLSFELLAFRFFSFWKGRSLAATVASAEKIELNFLRPSCFLLTRITGFLPSV